MRARGAGCRVSDFHARGWQLFPLDPALSAWREKALVRARAAIADPGQAHWWRHGATWFVGVGVLGNSGDGSVDGTPLQGAVVDALADLGLAPAEWDTGQVSVIRPGYPGKDPNESAAAHRFRRVRDAAHVDGILPVGAERRRKAQEFHGFILGLPLTDASAGASPLVVWEGSHHKVAAAFRKALADIPSDAWAETDITEVYQGVRREVFETCERVELPLRPGEALLVHRFAVHGIAPWHETAVAAEEGRAVAYFRPEIDREAWLFGT